MHGGSSVNGLRMVIQKVKSTGRAVQDNPNQIVERVITYVFAQFDQG